MPEDMLQMDKDEVAYYARHAGASNRVVMRHQLFVNSTKKKGFYLLWLLSREYGLSLMMSLKKRPLFLPT
jgi:hypothetical protein